MPSYYVRAEEGFAGVLYHNALQEAGGGASKQQGCSWHEHWFPGVLLGLLAMALRIAAPAGPWISGW